LAFLRASRQRVEARPGREKNCREAGRPGVDWLTRRRALTRAVVLLFFLAAAGSLFTKKAKREQP